MINAKKCNEIPFSAKSSRSHHTHRLKMRLGVEGLSLSQLPLLAAPPAKLTARWFYHVSQESRLARGEEIFVGGWLFSFFCRRRVSLVCVRFWVMFFLAWQNRKPKSKFLGNPECQPLWLTYLSLWLACLCGRRIHWRLTVHNTVVVVVVVVVVVR